MLYPPRSFKVCLKILIYFELTFVSGPNCCLACVYPVLRTPFTKMTVFSLLCVPAWKCCVSLYLGSVFCFTDLYVYSYASTILFWLNFYIKNDKNLMKEVEKDTNKFLALIAFKAFLNLKNVYFFLLSEFDSWNL